MNNEPVAWMTENRYLITKDENLANIIKEKGEEPIIPLYTHPAKTLTDEEIEDFTVRIYNCRTGAEAHEIVLAILKKAQEK
jgi:hypothetical protein